MQETALQDLDPRLQQQIENARKAVSKNPVYAIDILMNIMERYTGCLEARKILRQAQKQSNKGNSRVLSKLFSKFSMGGSKPAKGINIKNGIFEMGPNHACLSETT